MLLNLNRTVVPLLVMILALSSACGKSAAPRPDGDEDPKDEPADLAPDVPEDVDSGPEPLPDVCEGACAQQAVTASFGAQAQPMTQAAYGLTAPAASDSGEWELFLEVWDGGFEGCPQEGSPQTKRTLVLTGLRLPLTPGPLTQEPAPRATLFDYEGTLYDDALFARAAALTITPVAAKVCESCSGQGSPSDPEGFIALDVSMRFDDPVGSLTGRIFAKHCDSLDVLQP